MNNWSDLITWVSHHALIIGVGLLVTAGLMHVFGKRSRDED
jgi:hypothetical protein